MRQANLRTCFSIVSMVASGCHWLCQCCCRSHGLLRVRTDLAAACTPPWRVGIPCIPHEPQGLGKKNTGEASGTLRQANLRAGGLRRYLVFTAWLVVAAPRPAAAAEPIPNIGPAGEVVKVATGFGFTEGPAWDGKALLYFTDIPNARIHTVNAAGETAVFVEESGPCNGLMFNREGELVACNMGGQLVAWNVATKEKRVLAGEFEGKRFNAPNDLVIDAAGGIYFTDPMFRAPQPLPQGVQGVYYRSADGKVSRVVNDAPAPNGVLLSRDEKTLYVLPSMSAEMQAYPVKAPGQLGDMRVFCKVKNPPGRDNGGCDGATIDEHGNLYLTTALGVQVFSPSGEALGVIEVPEQPSNCTFGGPDGKTLYVTARTSLYSFPMLVKGHWYAQGEVSVAR